MNNLHQAQSHQMLRSWQSQRTDFNHPKDFVLPLFIGNEDDSTEPIEAMPGVNRYGCNRALEYLKPLVHDFGLSAVLLFPVITKKDFVAKHRNDTGDDEPSSDEEDGEQADVEENIALSSSSSSSLASNSSSVRSSSTAPSASSSDNDDDDDAGSVPRERLLAEVGEPASSPSQNPFLNQNEEEADHLLGDQSDRARDDETGISSSPLPPPPPPPPAHLPMGPRRRRVSRSLDVKLIRGLALKDEHNPVLRLIPKLREQFPELLIICDVCLCAFTSTGHCCLFEESAHLGGTPPIREPTCHNHPKHHPLVASPSMMPISNKITCQYLASLSVEYGRRGCNVVAPSDMMDGRIQTIRKRLEEEKLSQVAIMSYSAKFASAFYGPFRSATHNAPEFGDRKSYQLPPGSRALALKAVRRDLEQGADVLMVKPASCYLDIVRDIRENHPEYPIAVYQVSGEYSMLKVAAQAQVLDLRAALNELLTSYRRAGATIIISYFTPEILRGEL